VQNKAASLNAKIQASFAFRYGKGFSCFFMKAATAKGFSVSHPTINQLPH